MRKRPHVTRNNRKYITKIWGNKGKTDIFIPMLIENYNYWMSGVDVSDQWILYYHPGKIVCQ